MKPRFLSLPGLLKSLDGWLMARGTEATVRRVARTLGATVIDAHFGYPDGYAATRIGARLGLPVVINPYMPAALIPMPCCPRLIFKR